MIGINIYMKNFYPTYLYVKTHNITGLKYFGKTTGDPFKYRGSGKYWIDHLKIHGNDVSTEIVGLFEDKDECVATALNFSTVNNIVHAVNEDNKKIWANQIIENGIDGGATRYGPHSTETKQKISAAQTGKNISEEVKNKIKEARKLQDMSHMKKPKSAEQKKKISESLAGRKRSPVSIFKTAEKLRGRKRPDVAEKLRGKTKTPETIAKMKAAQQNKGPVSEETKQKIKEARASQSNVFPLGEYLKGKVIVVDKSGNKKSISKEVYYAQTGPKHEWEWVSHKSKEASVRRG